MQNAPSSNSVDKVIGSSVRDQRMHQGKTPLQVADALCVSEAVYRLCEVGELAFQAGDLFTLADYFGIQVKDLMPSKADLAHVDSAERYGEPQEVRDLIYYFSGVVSPALRKFFLSQIENASTQGRRETLPTIGAEQHQLARKKVLPFRFRRAS